MNKSGVVALPLLAACAGTSPAPPPGGIGIVIFDGVLTSDVVAPAEVFGVAYKRGWTPPVYFVSTTRELQITSEEGVRLTADFSIYDAPQLDVVFTGSSYDMSAELANADLMAWLRTQQGTADWMASNCAGAYLLAESGVLDGKRATTWFGGEADLQSAYPAIQVQTDARMVMDEHVLTSNGGVVSYPAAIALLTEMVGEEKATEVAESLQMNRL